MAAELSSHIRQNCPDTPPSHPSAWRPPSCAQPSDKGGQVAELGDTERRAAGREDDEGIVRLGARPTAGQRSQLPAVVIEEDAIRMPPPMGVDSLKLLPEQRME